MAKTINKQEFIDYLNAHVNKSIYVWGAQGEDLATLTEAKIRRMETSTSNANKAIKLLNARKNIKGAKAFDCSGLGMYFLQNLKGLYGDMTANDIMKCICSPIKKKELKKGDFVFKCYANGKAYHIGYVVDDQLNVVESQGRAYGVVKRPLSKGGWNKYGRPKFYADEKETASKLETNTTTTKPAGGTCTVNTLIVKKGVKGEPVKACQAILKAKGYKDGDNRVLEIDGSCGDKTVAAIKKFQKAKGLGVDGSCGPMTWNALLNG